MSKDPDKPESVGRRAFFRDLFVSAIEGAEKVGRQFAERSRFPYHEEPEPPRRFPSSYSPPQYDQYQNPEYQVYGPPWPPPYGPPAPPRVREELRERGWRTVPRGEV